MPYNARQLGLVPIEANRLVTNKLDYQIAENMNEKEKTKVLSQDAVSTRFSLVKMQERVDNGIKKYWHLVDSSGVGGYEYTLCGKAYTDSTMHSEDFEFIEEKKGGKITCPLCIKHLNWCRSIK